VILAMTTEATGNQVTALRLPRVAEGLGWRAWCLDVREVSGKGDLEKYLQRERVDGVLGVHAHRAGRLLVGSPVPYCILLGGTDANVFVYDTRKRAVMSDAVKGSRTLISFGGGMLSRMQRHLDYAGPAVLMPQSVAPPSTAAPGGAWAGGVPPGAAVFVLPCGLRDVKDPSYLVDAFRAWHAEDARVWLLVIGPILDNDCASRLFSAIGGGGGEQGAAHEGVAYHPPVPRDRLLALLCSSAAVLNSSLSEGMSNTLLEAMACGAPVVARACPGNLELVRHRRTGLLYSSPSECVALCKELRSDPRLSSALTDAAGVYVSMHHSQEKERSILKSALEGLLDAH